MRTLLLLRHAKSAWDDPSLGDHDRPLASRGRRAAPAVGRWIEANGLTPDLVLCSTAERARQTWELVAAELDTPIQVEFDRELYLAGPSGMVQRIWEVTPDVETLAVVGHNPGMHELTLALTDPAEAGSEIEALGTKFPTGGLAVIQFELDDWRELRPASGHLDHFVRPKDLPDT